MHITCTSSMGGNVNRFYRSSDKVLLDLKPYVSMLSASKANVLLAREDDGPGLVLTVGPINGAAESGLRRRTERPLIASTVGSPTIRRR